MPKIFVLRHQLAQQQAKLKANDKGGDTTASNSPPLSSPAGAGSGGNGSEDENPPRVVQAQQLEGVQVHVTPPSGLPPHAETLVIPPGLVIQPVPQPGPRQPPPGPPVPSGKTLFSFYIQSIFSHRFFGTVKCASNFDRDALTEDPNCTVAYTCPDSLQYHHCRSYTIAIYTC